MKISFAVLSAAACLGTAQAASAQSIYSPPRPVTAMPGQSGWVLIASSMNNYHPNIGNGAIAANANAAMQPIVPPSIPAFSTFRTMPFGSVPAMPASALPLDPMRAR